MYSSYQAPVIFAKNMHTISEGVIRVKKILLMPVTPIQDPGIIW